MFPYFGRKARLAHLYPPPLHDIVIEPFAGSMAYTFHWRPDWAIGIELDDRVVNLFRSLATGRRPARPELGTKTSDLFAKLATYSEHSLTSDSLTVTSRMLRDWEPLLRRVGLEAPYAASSILYRSGSYEMAPDIEATWFIDPPYQHANRRGYRYGAKVLDHEALAEWVKDRRGQVIVCEQEGADWLPFQPLADMVSHRGVRRSELVWVNV